ncbi:PKD domain-containing protein [Candidatus Gottesmanbacteria bacterium]|nr:PKD domain-containing protein [Candidatus Gottesmanbacteria bacterium]
MKFPSVIARKRRLTSVRILCSVAFFALCIIAIQSPDVRAESQGLAATFTWPGKGNGTLSARLINNSYTSSEARVEYGLYWCKRANIGGDNGCAPDFTGERKADETLVFQNVTLLVPPKGQSRVVTLPEVSALRGKACGRFQVDLGFPSGGGIVGGQVFTIGGDCPGEPPPPVQDECPYASTQVRLQKNSRNPWNSEEIIRVNKSVLIGGFHNGTGRFAGDPANSYRPNTRDVDFFITDPSGAVTSIKHPRYPSMFIPNRAGTYTVQAKTRTSGGGYFKEDNCKDTATLRVLDEKPEPSATPRATPTPMPSPSTSPSPTPGDNLTPECVSLSATPVFGGAQLKVTFIGNGRDLDGRITKLEFNFGDSASQTVDVEGETNKDTIVTVNHTYTLPGIYQATLRVRDNSGKGNEWSLTPESCKVKIDVQGQILGGTTVTSLPKAGTSLLYGVWYTASALMGIAFKRLSGKIRQH